MVKTIFADGSTSQVAYDTNGRKSSETDPMGLTTYFGYDAQGHLASVELPAVVDPENNNVVTVPTTTYAYDNFGNMTSITDTKGRVTSFTFDQFGHQLTRTLPMGQSESSTFDAFGRLDTHTDFKGQKEVYYYDSLGRNDTQTFYAAGSQIQVEAECRWHRPERRLCIASGAASRTQLGGLLLLSTEIYAATGANAGAVPGYGFQSKPRLL
jgi:YD repeat-containing protein